MKWLKDLFKRRDKQKELKVVETVFNNLQWEDRSYLVDLIFIYNGKTKRNVRKLMESNTNLNKEEVRTIVKLGSKKMREIRAINDEFLKKQR